MNAMLVAAAGLAAAVGLTHSIVGEIMIFLRQPPNAPGDAHQPLEAGRHRGILRASWHVTTFLGLAVAAVVLHFGLAADPAPPPVIRTVLAIAMGGSAAAVSWWTRARHPGWLGLAAVAILIWFA